MGKDYRHYSKNRIQQYDEDGFDGFHKLPAYDRDKNRKQNKFNMNHLEVFDEPVDELPPGLDGFVSYDDHLVYSGQVNDGLGED